MKHKKIFLCFLLLFICFFCPKFVFADAEPMPPGYTYNTYIQNWHDYYTLTPGDATNITIYSGELFCSFDDYQAGLCSFTEGSTIVIEDFYDTFYFEEIEEYPYTFSFQPTSVSFSSITSSNVQEYAFSNYRSGSKTGVLMCRDSDYNGGSLCESVSSSSDSDLSTEIYTPNFTVSYKFIVRGDLADPNGYFSDEVDIFGNPGEVYELGNLSYLDLQSYYQRSSDFKYILYDSPTDGDEYNISVLLENGDSMDDNLVCEGETCSLSIDDDILCEGETCSLSIEVIATLNYEGVNTGLFYDIIPFCIVIGFIVGFYFVFRKNRITLEEVEEDFDYEEK